jgi:hypothetical protein
LEYVTVVPSGLVIVFERVAADSSLLLEDPLAELCALPLAGVELASALPIALEEPSADEALLSLEPIAPEESEVALVLVSELLAAEGAVGSVVALSVLAELSVAPAAELSAELALSVLTEFSTLLSAALLSLAAPLSVDVSVLGAAGGADIGAEFVASVADELFDTM